jgi:hypothetical protein
VTVPTIPELADLIRQGLAEDERIAREACGATVVGVPGDWRQAPGGDEWAVSDDKEGIELLVGLRPGLPRLADPLSGYWGSIAASRDEDCLDQPGTQRPRGEFTHAARHDPARVLAEVASKRALLDEALGWRHDSECWSRHGPGLSCDCGLDKRVRAVLTHLAQPYQETK